MKKFKVGDRVGHYDELEWNPNEDDSLRGKVLEVNESFNKILVKWDNIWRKDPIEYSADHLMTEKELDKYLSKLEKEYNKFAKPIAQKLEQAAKLLSEAAKIAEANDKALADMHDEVAPLLGAMDEAGWRTSSLWC